jgi:glycosyltransferase involved in cell wall biosynthesis
MRIGFDAGPVFSSYSGIGQYVQYLFPAMFKRSPAIEWVAYASSKPSSQRFPLDPYTHVSWKSSKPSWFSGFTGASQNPPHIFHGTNYKAPDYGQKSTVLSIHDVWLARNPQYSKKFFGQALSSWKLGFRAKRVSRVIAVSQFSAREIQEVLGLPSEQITVIHHGCSPHMFPGREIHKFQDVRNRLQLPARPFILFVGGAEPRKNHRVLFEAFSQSSRLVKSLALVAVGGKTSRGDSLLETAAHYGITNFVHCPGYVSTEDLRMLYVHAECFVFPSLYEGFGLPLLDAMACGAPMITGTESALPEVAGDAALYVNCHNPEQLQTELERLVYDQDLQAHLQMKGFVRVKQFSWDRAAESTLKVYQEVLGEIK